MKKYTWILCLCGLLTISSFACQPSREDNGLQNEHANTYLTDDELDGYEAWVKEEKNFELVQHNFIESVDQKIEILKAQLANADMRTQIKIKETIDDLQARKNLLEAKLATLKDANEENWKEAKQEVTQASDSLKMVMEKIPA